MACRAKESSNNKHASFDDSHSDSSSNSSSYSGGGEESSSSESNDVDKNDVQRDRGQDAEILRWLGEALQQERQAMSLHVQQTLERRHHALLKELGPKLSSSTTDVKSKARKRNIFSDLGTLERIDEEPLYSPETDAPGLAVVPKYRSSDSSSTHGGDAVTRSRRGGFFLGDSRPLDLGEKTRYARFADLVNGPKFEIIFGLVIVLNAVIMALEMQYRGLDSGRATDYPGYTRHAVDVWPWAPKFFFFADWVLGITFTVELLLRVASQGRRFIDEMWNLIDSVIVAAWIVQAILEIEIGVNPTLLRLVRLVRLLRLLRVLRTIVVFDPLYLMMTAIRHSFSLMVWSLLVLVLVQMCLAILLQSLLEDYVRDPNNHNSSEVYKYFGSFSRTMLTMFEMTLGNWMIPCRALVENVSEWYSMFFLLHKFVIGFSVVGIITAVFIQETFKVAGSDDTIMLKNQERSIKLHEKKMTELFKHADEDGDGSLTRPEFMEVMGEPVVKHWLASMGLQVEDAGLVFDMLEGFTGKQEVTASDLVKGAARLKGSARHIDLVALTTDHRQTDNLLKQISDRLMLVMNTVLEEDYCPARHSTRVSLHDPPPERDGAARFSEQYKISPRLSLKDNWADTVAF